MKTRNLPKIVMALGLAVFWIVPRPAVAQAPEPTTTAGFDLDGATLQERNKAIARAFYQDLWFTNHTDRYSLYVADEYVVHDTGDRKNVTEPAVKQKEIADYLHSQGKMSGSIDFQIAEGDLVATRWQGRMEPTSLLFRLLGGRNPLPIINVFRFRDGKIIEIWNHRHDIDTGRANLGFVKGVAVGLLVALLGWAVAFARRRSREA